MDPQIKATHMRKIIASEYVTVDGVFEDPGGAENTGFGGWSFEFWNDEAARYKRDELFASSTLLLGRVTYEGFAKAWPTMEGTGEFGTRMNGIQKVVVSTTLKHATWSFMPGGAADCDSTALVDLALFETSQDVTATTGSWAVGGTSPLAGLERFQVRPLDTPSTAGGFRYQLTSDYPKPDVLSSEQALLTLSVVGG